MENKLNKGWEVLQPIRYKYYDIQRGIDSLKDETLMYQDLYDSSFKVMRKELKPHILEFADFISKEMVRIGDDKFSSKETKEVFTLDELWREKFIVKV